MAADFQIGEVNRCTYIHIPFCLSKCSYCSFYSVAFCNAEIEKYCSYLHREIQLHRDLWNYNEYTTDSGITFYFGGGSPSLLNSTQINSILYDILGSDFQNILSNHSSEITLEINPIQINERFLRDLIQTPVNRISLGLQSMLDEDLVFLGRRHRRDQTREKIQLLRSFGYENISLDLMYGLPDATLEGLKENLKLYLELAPEHISSYLLNLDNDCPMAMQKPQLPDDDLCADLYSEICSTLQTAGFIQYEISNFALAGKESQHNMCYWKSENYIALGASAAGFINPLRYQNPADLAKYYAAIDRCERFQNGKILETEELKAEFVMMGLRLSDGIQREEYCKRFGMDILSEKSEQIQRLKALKMVDYDSERLWLCQNALFVSNSVIGELL